MDAEAPVPRLVDARDCKQADAEVNLGLLHSIQGRFEQKPLLAGTSA